MREGGKAVVVVVFGGQRERAFVAACLVHLLKPLRSGAHQPGGHHLCGPTEAPEAPNKQVRLADETAGGAVGTGWGEGSHRSARWCGSAQRVEEVGGQGWSRRLPSPKLGCAGQVPAVWWSLTKSS